MQHYDIIISGAGMVGQALACLLAQQTDYKIALIAPSDKNITPNQTPNSRVSAITLASEQLLKQLNAWDDIPRKTPYHTVKVWDTQAPATLSFNAKDSGQTYLGHIIENDLIQYALNQQISQHNISRINDEVKVMTKINDGYQVKLSRQTLSSNLLVGADGKQSLIRQLANIGTTNFNYEQQGIVALLASKIGFSQSIYQWFTQQGIIAILPISDKVCSLVWSCHHTRADELLALNDTNFAQQLSQAMDYHFGTLSMTSPRQTFALHQISANTYVKPNLALIGDSAHHIHPLAGQGVNLGFLDVISLSSQLGKVQKSVGNLRYLKRYERNRQPDNQLMSSAMSGFYWLNTHHHYPAINWLSGLGMTAINHQPTLKKYLQQFASG